MSNKQSNLYAERLLSEHPLAMWSLDSANDYITYISEPFRDFSTWTVTGGNKSLVSSNNSPFPDSYTVQVNGTATPTYGNSAITYFRSSSSFTTDSSGYTASFYIKTNSTVYLQCGYGGLRADIYQISVSNAGVVTYKTTEEHGFSIGDRVQVIGTIFSGDSVYDRSGTISYVNGNQFRFQGQVGNYGRGTTEYSPGTATEGVTQDITIEGNRYPKDSWIPVSVKFNNQVTNKSFVMNFIYNNTNPTYYINGLTIGKNSEPFNGESFGKTLSTLPLTIPTTQTQGIQEKSFGTEKYSAYYIGSGKDLYAKNAGMSMSYGSENSMIVYPHATSGQPSFIFPGFGILNESGRYKELTLETLIRINSNNSVPKRILGPIASTDGIYVTKDFLMLKVGDYIGTYYMSEMFRPMILQLQMGINYANLVVDGETVISLNINSDTVTLASKTDYLFRSNEWLGFFAYSDVPFVEVDAIAIYPYKCSSILAKRRLVYAQGLDIPSISNKTYNGKTALIDYSFSNYTNNYNYPSFQAKWGQATISDNFEVVSELYLSSKKYSTPKINVSTYTSAQLLADSYATYLASGETNSFITLKPTTVVSGSGRNWSSKNNTSISTTSFDKNTQLASGIYGIFKSKETSASEQTLIKLLDTSTGKYLKISLTGTNVSYTFSDLVTPLGTLAITQNYMFTVGFDIQKLINSKPELASFFANRDTIVLYIGGDSSLENTFSGNIYKVGLCSPNNFSSITGLFNSSGILSSTSVNINTQTPTISSGTVTITTAAAHNFVTGDIVKISGVSPNGYNGTFTVTATPSSTRFSFVNNTTGNITTAGTVYKMFHSSLLSKTASYTVTTSTYFDKLNLTTATNSYWQDYVPLSKLAKTVYDANGKEVQALDFIQLNIDYPETKTYSSGAFSTTTQPLRGYVTFQKLADGPSKPLREFTTLVSANENRVIDATTYSAVKKYEFVNGMIVYPPTNLDLNTLAMVIHLELNNDDADLKQFKLENLDIASQSFNKNEKNAVGTVHGVDLYPYPYKTKNPYLIYKKGAPYLYLTKHSGIRTVGSGQGAYIEVGTPTTYSKIVSVQMSIMADLKEITSSNIFSINGRNGTVTIKVSQFNNSTNKGIISATYPYGSSPPSFYLNGKLVSNPVIELNEWNVLGVSFNTPVDVSYSNSKLTLSSKLLVNNISYYYANPIESDQKTEILTWDDISDNNWAITIPAQTPTRSGNSITIQTTGDHNLVLGEKLEIWGLSPSGYNTVSYGGGNTRLTAFKYTDADLSVTALPTSSSFTYENSVATGNITIPSSVYGNGMFGTWEFSSIPNYYKLYSNNLKNIYKIYLGTNKTVVDTYLDSQALMLNSYKYSVYTDITMNTIKLNLV